MKYILNVIFVKNGLFLFGGIVMIIFAITMLKPILTPAQDLYQISAEDISTDSHITAEIDFVYDYYAVESEDETIMGITVNTKEDTGRWYILPIQGDTPEGFKFITVRVNPKDYDVFDRIVDNTWAYINYESDVYGQETYTLDARVIKLDREMRELYYDWYGREFMEEADQYIAPYILVPNTTPFACIFFIGFGVLIFLISIISILRSLILGRA